MKKPVLLVSFFVLVFIASGCIKSNEGLTLESMDYKPPENFEAGLTFLGLNKVRIIPENESSYQIYANGKGDYIYAGKVRLDFKASNNDELKEFFSNNSLEEENSTRRITSMSSGTLELGNHTYSELNISVYDKINTGKEQDTEWNWTQHLLLTNINNSNYGFFLTETTSLNTTYHNERGRSFNETLYSVFKETVEEAKIDG